MTALILTTLAGTFAVALAAWLTARASERLYRPGRVAVMQSGRDLGEEKWARVWGSMWLSPTIFVSFLWAVIIAHRFGADDPRPSGYAVVLAFFALCAVMSTVLVYVGIRPGGPLWTLTPTWRDEVRRIQQT